MTKAINSKNSRLTTRTCWGVHLQDSKTIKKKPKNKFLYLLPFSSVTWLFLDRWWWPLTRWLALAPNRNQPSSSSGSGLRRSKSWHRGSSFSLASFLCVDFFYYFKFPVDQSELEFVAGKKPPKTFTLVCCCCCCCLVWPFYAPSFISTHVHKHLEASHFELSYGSGCGSSCRAQKSYAQTLQVQRSGLYLALKYVRSFKFKGITGAPYQAGNDSARFFAALAAWILFSAGSGTTRHPRQLELRRPLFFLAY